MRPMTEAQAWAYLARKWNKPKVEHHVPRIGVGELAASALCLCWSISDLYRAGGADSDIRNRMDKRMVTHNPVSDDRAFWWPLTRAGARSRATFCRRMSKLAAKEARGR